MAAAQSTHEVTLDGLKGVAQLLALLVRPGDTIALRGDLGAGKTTFARFFVEALLPPADGESSAEIPSPTFALAQEYATPRMHVMHFDLYRLRDESELEEIGFVDATRNALVLIEWPERAGDALPEDRIEVALAEGAAPDSRCISVTGRGNLCTKAARLNAMRGFLEREGWAGADVHYLQGDASQRAYARLIRVKGSSAILMDSPRQPDGPPVRDGLPYSRIAHLAEDVRPFVAIAKSLRGAGLSAPEILAADLDHGLLLIEDLGDAVFGKIISGTGRPRQQELWTAAIDVLVSLRQTSPSFACTIGDGATHVLPRLDRPILEIETELLPSWYWPEVSGGAAMPAEVKADYDAIWSPLIDRLVADPPGWMLRDYHSPNLLWLPDREGDARVGVIDFQDALQGPWAHDVMSLLQDARVDVPAVLETRLLDRYCARMTALDDSFDEPEFRTVYAIYGALRATRLLGLWVRLLRRDGKPQYLQHAPRTWDYLGRNLRHPALLPLKAWYDRHLPAELRRLTLRS